MNGVVNGLGNKVWVLSIAGDRSVRLCTQLSRGILDERQQ